MKDKTIFITGCGTLATEIVRQLYLKCKKIIIFSRDEKKHYELSKLFPDIGDKGIRYFIGDIRDLERLKIAMKNVDIVIHTAALKHIDRCEYNVVECTKTNVNGTLNVAAAAAYNNVKKAIFISTDKAVNPISAYGTSKMLAERIWINYNNYGSTMFSTILYGNVICSNGSVINLWKSVAEKGEDLYVTNKDMTRFFISVEDATKFIINVIGIMERGVKYIPVMYSCKMIDIAKEFSKNIIIGNTRCCEKIHEELINAVEFDYSYYCYSMYMGDFFKVYPGIHNWIKKIENTDDIPISDIVKGRAIMSDDHLIDPWFVNGESNGVEEKDD